MLLTKPHPQSQVSSLQSCHQMPAAALLANTAFQLASPPPLLGVNPTISNDESHQILCLSLLKARYEPHPGMAIEQNMMYKQYVASLHRLGRSIAIFSAQNFHVMCIRAFGGSIGHVKQIGDNPRNYYAGIQARAVPLPLKQTLEQEVAAHKARIEQNQASLQNGINSEDTFT